MLERDLGEGACLMLGNKLSESHWYKLLPSKDGPRRNWALGYVRRARTAHQDRADVCGPLWRRLINGKCWELR